MFDSYTKPETREGDSYGPKDHVGRPLIVKVTEHKHIESTAYKPEGGPGVIASVVDLTDGEVYRDVLWMGGAVVDGLKRYAAGNPVVIKFGLATGKSGRQYVDVLPGDASEVALAEQYVKAKGDPFAPQIASYVPTQGSPQAQPVPAVAAPPWATQA